MANFNKIIEELKKDIEARKECIHLDCFCEERFRYGVRYAIEFIFDALKESEKC